MAKKVKEEFWCVGRRKQASARVRLRAGTGKLQVNNREFADFFTSETLRRYISQPLVLTNSLDKFDILVNIQGGGVMGQAGAMRHGLARSLIKANAEFHAVLKSAGMLTRDARVKERKKYGQPGARKRFQFSKR
jgi:small subunit ribosomal protein S9